MPILSHPAFGPRASLIYITVGALVDVFIGCYYFFMVDKTKSLEENHTTYFWLTSLFLTGVTLLVIGVLLGRIGQSARRAELPPAEVVGAEAAVQQNIAAAAVPTPVAAVPPGAAPPAPPAAPAGAYPGR